MATAFPSERTVVITGAASPRGIGRETARTLAARGWNVAILDQDHASAASLASELRNDHGVLAEAFDVDVTDQRAVDAAITNVEARFPQIVGLANIAGISSPTPFLSETAEGWNRVFAVNVTGVFFVTQRVAAIMARHGIGRVVSVSSVSFECGGGVFSKSAYSASKGAVVGLMRAVARELGPHGVTANSVSPGPVDTDIMGGTLTEDRKAAMSRNTLIGRVGTPSDVAAVIAFLLSEEAGNITGETIDTNGGMYLS